MTKELADRLYDRLSDLPNLRGEVVIDDRLHLSIGQRLQLATASGFPYVVALGKQAGKILSSFIFMLTFGLSFNLVLENYI